MPCREKVISGLHCRAQDLMIDLPSCNECDYQIQMVNRMGCDFRRLCKDAIALLKEQEAVEPIAKGDDTYECICGAVVGWDELDASGIVQTQFNYCPFCGRSVEWE